MKVRCSACSHEQDVSPAELSLGTGCVRCGQNLSNAKLELGSNGAAQRGYSIPSRARDDMHAATRDLFGNFEPPPRPAFPSVPVEMPAPEPDVAALRANENSIMFSLESLMKAQGRGATQALPPQVDTVSESQLWDMSNATPLFGTAQDQALLTTPMQPPTVPAHVMTVPSRRPARRRRGWKWVAGGLGVCGMAAAGWWGLNARSTTQATNQVTEVPVAAEPSPAAESPAGLDGTKPAALAPAEPQVVPAAVHAGGEVLEPSAAVPAVEPGVAAQDAPAPEAAAAAAPSDVAAVAEPPASTAPGSSTGNGTKRARNARKLASAAGAKPTVVGLPFNKSAAKDALGSATSKAAACGKSGGGSGKVQVTFAPTGRVSNASVTAGSFPGGTGGCIVRAFRAARVPPFAGAAVTVSKSFKIP